MASDDEDVGVLNKPAKTSKGGVLQVAQFLNRASKEIKDLLINECNIIYECKVCNSLFRSLPNFVVHKRGFCKEHCCEKMLLFKNSDVCYEDNTLVIEPEAVKDEDVVENSSDSDGNTNQDHVEGDSDGPSEEVPGDLVQENSDVPNSVESEPCDINLDIVIAETVQKEILSSTSVIMYPKKVNSRRSRKGIPRSIPSAGSPEKEANKVTLTLKKIEDTNNAVMQVICRDDDPVNEAAEDEQDEVEDQNMMECVSNNSERLENPEDDWDEAEDDDKVETAPHEDQDESVNEYVNKYGGLTQLQYLESRTTECDVASRKCNMCNIRYCNRKSLYKHMVSQHSKFRKYFPCTCCSSVFVQLWGISRHLKNCHGKSDEQIKRLRAISRKRGFFKQNRRTSSVPSEQEQNNNSETEKLNNCTVEPEINNYGNTAYICPNCGRIFGDHLDMETHLVKCKKTQADCSSEGPNFFAVATSDRPRRIGVQKKGRDDFVNSQTLNWRTGNTVTKQNRLSPNKKVVSPRIGVQKKNRDELDNSQTLNLSTENTVIEQNRLSSNKKVTPSQKTSSMLCLKANIEEMEMKIDKFINPQQLSCKLCKKEFSSSSNVRRHVAIHLNFSRFQCSYCNTKSYHRSVIRSHMLKLHSDKSITEENVDLKVIDMFPHINKDENAEISDINSSISNTTEDENSLTLVKKSTPEKASPESPAKNSPIKSSPPIVDKSVLTLVTRSGRYVKPDRMPNLQNQPDEEPEPETRKPSSSPEHQKKKTTRKRRAKSPWLTTRRKKLQKSKDVTRKASNTYVDELKMVANCHTSSDESEPRVSKRKQSFTNVLIDGDDKSIDRKDSLSLRSSLSSSQKLVISDDSGRFVTEVPVSSSLKISKKAETVPKKPIVGKNIKFDSTANSSSRYHISLLRKMSSTQNQSNSSSDVN